MATKISIDDEILVSNYIAFAPLPPLTKDEIFDRVYEYIDDPDYAFSGLSKYRYYGRYINFLTIDGVYVAELKEDEMPKIISFAWTTKALLDGHKTVTRRDWNDKYAESFHKDDICLAYDTNPRNGGKKIAIIRLTKDPYKQWLHCVNDEDEMKEGGLWGCGKAYQEAMGIDRELWVIEFELIKTL